MKINFTSILIYVLVGTAIILGYLIYRQLPDDSAAPTQTEIEGAAPDQQSPQEVPQGVLAFPKEVASQEERRRFADMVREEAKEVSALDIGGCTPDPLVLRVKHGQSVTVKNPDAAEHRLVHKAGRESSVIPARGAKDIIIYDFVGLEDGDEGFAGYLCDGELAGVFYIIPN